MTGYLQKIEWVKGPRLTGILVKTIAFFGRTSTGLSKVDAGLLDESFEISMNSQKSILVVY